MGQLQKRIPPPEDKSKDGKGLKYKDIPQKPQVGDLINRIEKQLKQQNKKRGGCGCW